MGPGADAKIVKRVKGKLIEKFAAGDAYAKSAGKFLARAIYKDLKIEKMQLLKSENSFKIIHTKLSLDKAASLNKLKTLAFQKNYRGKDFILREYVQKPWARQQLLFPNNIKALPYRIQSWKLGGRLTLCAMEGEICSPYGALARSLNKNADTFVIGYANRVQGYIPDLKIRRQGGYEGIISHMVYYLPASFSRKIEKEVSAALKKVFK